MKTTTKLKIIAVFGTISFLPVLISKEIQIYYFKLYNTLLEAKLKNPDLTWMGFKI
jgi:hypothetical protein